MFVARMQAKARAADGTPEDYLLRQAPLMTWAGNAPPLLTICDMETGHAIFSNLLKVKGFAKTGPAAFLEDTMLQCWRNTVEGRNLDEIDRIVPSAQGARKPKRNQYSAGGPGHMLGQVNRIVESTIGEWQRRRCMPPALRPGKLGALFLFKQRKIREAKALGAAAAKRSWQQWEDFRTAVRVEWGRMSNNAKKELHRRQECCSSREASSSSSCASRISSQACSRLGDYMFTCIGIKHAAAYRTHPRRIHRRRGST